jgi:phosphatidylserine/phosphatidylglycerophosphate/cardiolipin synthase-like enzyme
LRYLVRFGTPELFQRFVAYSFVNDQRLKALIEANIDGRSGFVLPIEERMLSSISEIRGASRDLLFCTAFDLDDRIEEALLGDDDDDILRLGLENSRSKVTGFHRDRTADFVANAYLGKGLERVLKESTAGQRGNILIHTKLIVIDFTSDAPTVISGSHNLSGSAFDGNDENDMILRGNSDVADCYGVELLRLYEHYRFRWHAKKDPNVTHPEDDPCPRPADTLCPDDRWTVPYFEEGSLTAIDRRRFAAPVS